jgi:hypothetical protein
MKLISSHVLPDDNVKTHKFLTNKGKYIVEVETLETTNQKVTLV